jgi:hypothetical protein
MPRISLHKKTEILPYIEPFQLGGGVTIDSAASQYDDGFLACARTGWVNPKADGTFVDAAANLAGYSLRAGDKNISKLVLVGHGQSGLISTGDGNQPRTAQGYISSWTYSAWSASFAKVSGHGVFLTLCGCDCGADAVGAQFLYQLATLLNMPVQGRTGLIYLSCPGAVISYETGSVWQVAQPGVLPNPIPKPFIRLSNSAPREINLVDRPPVDFRSFQSVSIKFPRKRVVELDDVMGQSLLALANVERPFLFNGVPSAVLTATISLTTKSRRSESRITFRVYNDRLLQAESNPTVYYGCSSAFSQGLNDIRSR